MDAKNENTEEKNMQASYHALRRNLGILGLTTPVILLLGNIIIYGDPVVKTSVSHYYYTGMGIYFTGIMWAFGMFLFAYKGYKKDSREFLSDNLLTTLAGIFAIVTALIPTAKNSSVHMCAVNGHCCHTWNYIHLGCAALFLLIMGWMSLFKFTRSKNDKLYKYRKNILYIVCGVIVWVSLLTMGIDMMILRGALGKNAVFIFETIALWAFGIAWLAKSEELDPVVAKIVGLFRGKTATEVLEEKR